MVVTPVTPPSTIDVMNQSPESEASHGGWLWIALVLLLPVFYVLSIGPVGAYTKNKPPSTLNAARKFYAPVIWLHDNTPLEKPIRAYVELWGFH